MKNKLEDVSFPEFIRVISEYVQLAKETNNNPIELAIFEQEHPAMFSTEMKNFLSDFLNAVGFTDELLDKLRRGMEIEQSDSNTLESFQIH